MKFKIISFFIVLSHFYFYSFSQSRKDVINEFFQETTSFLEKYVHEGKVDYEQVNKNIPGIQKITGMVQNLEYDEMNDTAKALWINIYNLLVIQQVVENYPVNSPMDVKGFFDQNKYEVMGQNLTLNEIEKEKLLEVYHDARLHFVLVCAAKGCPVIEKFAYKPSNLDAQLDRQTRKAINDPDFVRVDKNEQVVNVSELFRWYKEDFLREAENILTYINKYREKEVPPGYSLKYYSYNWELNNLDGEVDNGESKDVDLQSYTPSALLRKGQWEFKNFNNIYTQTSIIANNGISTQKTGIRETWFSSINQFLYGINQNINVGFDVWVKSVRIENNPGESFINVFKFENIPGSRTAITGVGPKLKISPIKQWDGFSMQTTFLFPLEKDLEGRSPDAEKSFLFLEHDRYLWLTQFFYDKSIGSEFQLFLQFSPWVSFVRNSYRENHALETPTSIFGSYFPNSKTTLYLMTEYWPTHYDSNEQKFSPFNSFFVQSGVGGKYLIIPGFMELEVLYTNFWLGSTGSGAGQTFNFGIRLIR